MALTMSLIVTAQEKTRQMEVGLAFRNLNSFGLTFKIGSKKSFKGYTYEPGINFVFGLNYVVNDKFVIGADILPGFSYYTGTLTEMNYYINYGNETKTNFSGFNYGLSNTSVLVSLAYRFK